MKVDTQSLAYIQNVVKTAELVKIDNIIIEPDRVRAIDENRTVVICQNDNVPVMPFGSIGINRLSVFSSRFNMARSIDEFEVNAVVEGDKPETMFARSLTMKAKGIKIDYRCANPATIKAPKSINDELLFRIKMSPEAVLYIQQGSGAMDADEVTFIGSNDGVSFELSDINSDKLDYKFADKVEIENKMKIDNISFSHRYPIKTILPLFRINSDSYFYITTKGILKITVNNLDIYVLPRT